MEKQKNYFKNFGSELGDSLVGEKKDKLEISNKNKNSNNVNEGNPLTEDLAKRRATWNERIANLVPKLRKMDEYVDVEVSLYTYRQMIVEERAKISTILSNLNKNLRLEKANSYEDVKINGNIRTKTYSETETFVDKKTSNRLYEIDVFKVHLEFLVDVLKGLDNLSWELKNRIKIHELDSK